MVGLGNFSPAGVDALYKLGTFGLAFKFLNTTHNEPEGAIYSK